MFLIMQLFFLKKIRAGKVMLQEEKNQNKYKSNMNEPKRGKPKYQSDE